MRIFKSRSLKNTLAALVFAEATAKYALAANLQNEDVTNSAKGIMGYCDEAGGIIGQQITLRDLDRFSRALKSLDGHFPDNQPVNAQKMIAFSCMLLEAPVTKTKNKALNSCLQSIADLLVWMQGVMEIRDGGAHFESLREAEAAFRIWEGVRW